MTLNVFDLPPVRLFYFLNRTLSWDRDIRLNAILQAIQGASTQQGWDVILLQELWSEKYRRLFKETSGYHHSIDLMAHTMPEEIGILNGATVGFGSGLMILSKWPVKSPDKLEFTHNGRWINVGDGEVSVQKGAISGIIEHPTLGDVLMINTHMVARYPDHQYSSQRRLQLKELVQFTQDSYERHKCPVIVGGDFNFGPWQGNHLEKLHRSGELFDQFISETRVGDQPLRHAKGVYLLPEMATYHGFYEGSGNPYVCYKDHGLQIIDHLLCSSELLPESPRVCFTELMSVNGKAIPYSDHYGLEVSFHKDKC